MSWMAARPWVRPVKPATVTIILRPHKREDAPPAFDLYVPARTLDALGWTGKTRLALSIGADADAGWLRIAPADKDDDAGVALHTFGQGAGRISFGRLAGIFDGLAGRATVCFDRHGDAIALAVPGAASFQARKGRGGHKGSAPVPAAKAAAAAPAAKASPAANGAAAQPVTKLHGLTIDLSHGEESLTFAGRTMDVNASQAALARLIARAAPSPVGEAYLTREVYGGDAHGEEKFKVACADLGKALAAIGLGLKVIKGVGLQMTGLKIAGGAG